MPLNTSAYGADPALQELVPAHLTFSFATSVSELFNLIDNFLKNVAAS